MLSPSGSLLKIKNTTTTITKTVECVEIFIIFFFNGKLNTKYKIKKSITTAFVSLFLSVYSSNLPIKNKNKEKLKSEVTQYSKINNRRS